MTESSERDREQRTRPRAANEDAYAKGWLKTEVAAENSVSCSRGKHESALRQFTISAAWSRQRSMPPQVCLPKFVSPSLLLRLSLYNARLLDAPCALLQDIRLRVALMRQTNRRS